MARTGVWMEMRLAILARKVCIRLGNAYRGVTIGVSSAASNAELKPSSSLRRTASGKRLKIHNHGEITHNPSPPPPKQRFRGVCLSTPQPKPTSTPQPKPTSTPQPNKAYTKPAVCPPHDWEESLKQVALNDFVTEYGSCKRCGVDYGSSKAQPVKQPAKPARTCPPHNWIEDGYVRALI